MTKETEITSIVRFNDGKFLGSFNCKVEKMLDALKFNGDWKKDIQFQNQQHLLNTEPYEIKRIRVDIQLLD